MLPNFIVIGAAKAGTTSLHWYLTEHPSVFMCPVKDASYFAYGLDAGGHLIWGETDFHAFPVKSLHDYEQLFAEAGGAAAVGEASTMYLECPQSAGRIRELVPAARIICSIRHPVDRAYSDYLMYLRRRGKRFDAARDLTPMAAWARPDSRWMQIGRYHESLARYYEAFPSDHICVCVFDDLKRNREGFVQDVYRFLDVDPSFLPDFDTPHAPGGMPASVILENIFAQSASSQIKPLVPRRAANWFRRLRTKTMRPSPPLPAELRNELTRPFRADIEKTSALIGRSLNHWLAD